MQNMVVELSAVQVSEDFVQLARSGNAITGKLRNRYPA